MNRTLVATDLGPGRWVKLLDGTAPMSRELIGGKAWSVNRMRQLGLNVPPAVVLTTQAYTALAAGASSAADTFTAGGALADEVWTELVAGIRSLENATGRRFGGATDTDTATGVSPAIEAASVPLLVSVRSGAAESMPGMMDTVLNLGINHATRTVIDAHFGATSDDDARRFGSALHDLFCEQYRSLVLSDSAAVVPDDVWSQLRGAVAAVLRSWESPRARTYRRHHGISDDLGTSVTIQAMVFGNLDVNSGSGVLFTRNPATGQKQPYGQWLRGAQGEDVVSGRRDPEPLATLRDTLPAAHTELVEAGRRLEAHFGDVQDIEFTLESGVIWFLQARAAKRSPRAAAAFALQFCNEGYITREQALRRITPAQARQLLEPVLDPVALQQAELVATGEPACPGFAHGLIVTAADEAMAHEASGVILARPTTSPDDIHGMLASRAVVTELGGASSHAAVVSRELGCPCVVGCGEGVLMALAGQSVTVDGGSGRVYRGYVPTVAVDEEQDELLATLIDWAQSIAPLSVRPLAAMPAGAATDIGAGGRLPAVRSAALPRAVCGQALEADASIAACVAAGVEVVYVRQRLPALLGALRPSAAQRVEADPIARNGFPQFLASSGPES